MIEVSCTMGDPGTFWLISPKAYRLEASNFFEQSQKLFLCAIYRKICLIVTTPIIWDCIV